MILTKFEHACFVLESDGDKLVVDPGEFSHSLETAMEGVVAIIVTHVHGDHIDPKKIQQLVKANPESKLISTKEVANAHPDLPVIPVTAGVCITAGTFHLEFCGGEHALISPDKPVFQNVGVVVNESLYYPGDSFAEACREVSTLLAPASAPWLKISEAMEFIGQAKVKTVIPTHDALLSVEGKQIFDGLLQSAAQKSGATYKRLGAGESLEIT